MTPSLSTTSSRLGWRDMLRAVLAFVGALLLAAAWGSVVQTQFNLQALVALGQPIPLGTRLQTTAQDLAGFAPVLAGIVAAGWLPAFVAAAALARWQPRLRSLCFALAGGVGAVAAVRAVDAVAPMPVFVDATRHTAGLLAVCAGALLAGALFARWTAAAPQRATR